MVRVSSSASIATAMEFSTRKNWKVFRRVCVVASVKQMPMEMAPSPAKNWSVYSVAVVVRDPMEKVVPRVIVQTGVPVLA